MKQAIQTRESYIAAVRQAALAVAVLDATEREMLAGLKMVYGTGHGSGARGVTYHKAWQGNGHSCGGDDCRHEALIEICAFGEESLVQLAGTTIHEMAHALAGVGHGHDKEWSTCCKRLGLRAMKAAGTRYVGAMFVPALRERLAQIPVPVDGAVINWNGRGFTGLAGMVPVRVRPCSAGVGSRGGKSRGPGSGSRLRKWVCGCGVIARVSSDDFRAHCDRCGDPFTRAD